MLAVLCSLHPCDTTGRKWGRVPDYSLDGAVLHAHETTSGWNIVSSAYTGITNYQVGGMWQYHRVWSGGGSPELIGWGWFAATIDKVIIPYSKLDEGSFVFISYILSFIFLNNNIWEIICILECLSSLTLLYRNTWCCNTDLYQNYSIMQPISHHNDFMISYGPLWHNCTYPLFVLIV